MELLPCPFCGSGDIEEDYTCVTVIYGKEHQSGSIDCNQCGGSVYKEGYGDSVYTLSDRLISAWNKRTYSTKEKESLHKLLYRALVDREVSFGQTRLQQNRFCILRSGFGHNNLCG